MQSEMKNRPTSPMRVTEGSRQMPSERCLLSRDDMSDRDVEAAAGKIDQVMLEPVRLTRWRRRDQDLVGWELRNRIADREQRDAVPDLHSDRESVGLQYCQGFFTAALCSGHGIVGVR